MDSRTPDVRAERAPQWPCPDDFVRLLRDALSHLHDLPYLQRHPLAPLAASAIGSRDAGRALQRSLIETIESLKANPRSPTSADGNRGYELLRLRYVEALDVSVITEKLSISRSRFFDSLRVSVEAVASLLRTRFELAERNRPDPPVPSNPPPAVRMRPALPLPLTSFVGRERELAEVSGLIRTKRLLTLTGTGGCGKTRLAYETAALLGNDYPDGIHAVELAALTDPELVPKAVLSALDVPDASGRTTVEQLIWHLRPRTGLLVLDNCEHLADACARVAEALLRECPNLTILATSREPLGVPGEVTWRVPSLATTDDDGLLPDDARLLAMASACPAVQLFVDRAQAATPSFALAESNARAVAQIGRRLDGIPLAIELAAPWVRVLPVDDLLNRLEDRFRLLTGGSRTALPRQQTLAATVDWSYDRLTETERGLFARLSVFVGGWSLEEAEGVGAGGPIPKHEVLGLLARLVDKSLVVVDEAPAAGARYRLLETLREYGWRRLKASGDGDAVQERHADCFLALAERAESELLGARQGEWLARLALDADNLRQATRWLLERGDLARAQRLVGAIWRYWAFRGRPAEGRAQILEVLAGSSAASVADAAARAKALQGAGALAFYQGDYAESRLLLEQSAAIYRDLGDRRGIAWSLIYLGWGVCDAGAPERACQLFEEALDMARGAGDGLAAAWALARLGLSALFLGEFARAIPVLAESLHASLALGDRWGATWSQHLLVSAHQVSGEYEPGEMERLERECVKVWREFGARRDLAYSLQNLVDCCLDAGRLEEAASLDREALSISLQIGDMFGVLSSVCIGAIVTAARGHPEPALRLYAAVEALREASGATTEPAFEAYFERRTRPMVATLSEAAVAKALIAGRSMTLDEAVEYTLRD